MPHILAARLSAVAHRGRVVASLVGALALIVALFATAATAGARTHTAPGPAAKHTTAKHDANDKAGAKDKQGAKDDKAKEHKVKDVADHKPKDVAQDHPEQPYCKPGEVKKNGMCVPADECKPPYVVKNGECVPPPNNPDCTPPQVPQNGVCVTPPPVCTPPQVPQNGVCVTPPPSGNVAAQPVAQAPAATPTATPPASNVAGTRATAATARLQTQTRCGSRSFRVTISGRNIRRVTLFVAGRRVRTITMPAGRRSITVSVPARRFGARRQSVEARVTFRNGAAARTLTASATRCAQTAVSPQFTG
jgi:hypothetical protein